MGSWKEKLWAEAIRSGDLHAQSVQRGERHSMTPEQMPHITEELQKLIGKENTVVHVLSYTGEWTRWLTEVAGRVIAVDISPEIVEKAKELAPRAEFVVGEGSAFLPLNEEGVDWIFSFEPFPVTDRPHALPSLVARMIRARKGGIVVSGRTREAMELEDGLKILKSVIKDVVGQEPEIEVKASKNGMLFVVRALPEAREVPVGELLEKVTREYLRRVGFKP